MTDLPTLLKENIKKAIKSIYELDVQDVELEHPDNEQFGDYATSVCLSLTKQIRKPPFELAQALATELTSQRLTFNSNGNDYPIFSGIEAVQPGFINFKLSDVWLKEQMTEVLENGDKFGFIDVGKGKTILVEYSQPNPNKPMHIGHSRNNFIGSSLASIFQFSGYTVVKMNYMDDWGTHVCKTMLMYKKHADGKEPDKKSDHFVGDFYVMYEKEHEKNPEGLDKELADMFKKLEAHDEETVALWKKVVGWAYKGWESTYNDENVSFDVWNYQSNYTEGGKDIVKLALEKGIAEKDSTGAVIAKLEKYGIPDKVLLRSDGTSIYITQDTQMAKTDYEKYHFEKRIYVVDVRQSDYFKQLFKILELLGFDWAKRLYHLAYGWVSLPEGAMSSRLGTVVSADDVFEKLVDLETDEARNSLKEITNLDETARKVALAAFRYGILKVDSKQDIIFDYKKVTKFEGNTGPYLMYTYARAMSILEKAGVEEGKLDFNLQLFGDTKLETQELSLLRSIYKLPEIVLEASEGFMPHVVANYLYDLAQRFNSFYAGVPVLNADGDLRTLRLVLVNCFSQVMKNGLSLLGIDVVEKM